MEQESCERNSLLLFFSLIVKTEQSLEISLNNAQESICADRPPLATLSVNTETHGGEGGGGGSLLILQYITTRQLVEMTIVSQANTLALTRNPTMKYLTD